ncbi:MAG: hypothetical protein K2W95_28500 [Candidatus Obscuribacterales bacterium]|nr:hypothetical protein [Candidatus Obscuribacterales bacterium]
MQKRSIIALALFSFVFPSGSSQSARAAEALQSYNSGGITFGYPASWKKATAKKVAAVPLANPDDKPDGVAPAYDEISVHGLTIYVVPTSDGRLSAKEFEKKYPTVASAAKDLSTLLKANATSTKDTPIFPWADASTPFEAKKKQLSFKSGKAIRYIGEYLIEPDVIDNARLVYSAQGLSTDGKWYLSIIAPLKTKSLPDKSDISKWPQDKYKTFSADFAKYGAQVGAKLDKLPSSSFTPSIDEVDLLVHSIRTAK